MGVEDREDICSGRKTALASKEDLTEDAGTIC